MKNIFYLISFLFYLFTPFFISSFIAGTISGDGYIDEKSSGIDINIFHDDKIGNYILDLNNIICSLKDSLEESSISLNNLDKAVAEMEGCYCQLDVSEEVMIPNLLEIKKIIVPSLTSLKNLIMEDLPIATGPYNKIIFGNENNNLQFVRQAFSIYVKNIYSKPIFELKKIISLKAVNNIITVLNSLIISLTKTLKNKPI